MDARTFALIVGLALLIPEPGSSTAQTRDQKPTLPELARQRFGKGDCKKLSCNEKKLFQKGVREDEI